MIVDQVMRRTDKIETVLERISAAVTNLDKIVTLQSNLSHFHEKDINELKSSYDALDKKIDLMKDDVILRVAKLEKFTVILSSIAGAVILVLQNTNIIQKLFK